MTDWLRDMNDKKYCGGCFVRLQWGLLILSIIVCSWKYVCVVALHPLRFCEQRVTCLTEHRRCSLIEASPTQSRENQEYPRAAV
jgi:hypothetical protein